jgi:hypothetical protein
MSKYFTRQPLTIPQSRNVFLLESGQVKTQKIDDHIKGDSIEKLQLRLKRANEVDTLLKFRLYVFGISKALSNRGIAPRWQGLDKACKTDDQHTALIEDAPIIDAYWLALTFPKHKSINQRWQSLFTNGFDMELAVSISERRITEARKVRHDLNLSRLQQIGCIHFLRKSKFKTEGKLSALSQLESAKSGSQTKQEREIRRSDTTYQVTPKIAAYRALIWECYILADKSPTDTAKVYKWMTGIDTNRANVARTIKRIKEPVARKHVGVYP